MKFRLLALGIALAAAWPHVQAQSFLEIVNGSASRTTGASSQIVGSGIDFTVGKLRLALDPRQSAFITYAFEGAESSLREQFFGPGGSSMIDSRAAVGTLITTRVEAGLLDFGFQSAGAALATNQANYAWNDASVGIVLDAGRMSGRLLFEDGRSRLGPDFDFDDMVVRFSVVTTPVPEASTVVLLAAGLGVLGVAIGRRRRR